MPYNIDPTKKEIFIMAQDNVVQIEAWPGTVAFRERSNILAKEAKDKGYEVVQVASLTQGQFIVKVGDKTIVHIEAPTYPHRELTSLDMGYTVLSMMLALGWELKPGKKMPNENKRWKGPPPTNQISGLGEGTSREKVEKKRQHQGSNNTSSRQGKRHHGAI